MLIIFSIINFALILLAIFFIILLYIKFSNVQQLEHEYRSLLQEAEDTISSYVMELKEENANFLKRLQDNTVENNTVENNNEEQKNYDEREEELSAMVVNELLSQESRQEINEEPILKQEEFEDWHIKDQVLYLRESGNTPEEIARKLNKGITEIELLLKFRQ